MLTRARSFSEHFFHEFLLKAECDLERGGKRLSARWGCRNHEVFVCTSRDSDRASAKIDTIRIIAAVG